MANTVVEIAQSYGDVVSIDAEYDNNENIRAFTITNNGTKTVTAVVTKPSTGGASSASGTSW